MASENGAEQPRPRKNTNKGKSITRHEASVIAYRREIIKRLHERGWSIPLIKATLLNSSLAWLVTSQANPDDMISKDIAIAKQEHALTLREITPASGIVDFLAALRAAKDVVWEKVINPEVPHALQLRAVAEFRELAQAEARLHGIPTHAPALDVSINNTILAAGGFVGGLSTISDSGVAEAVIETIEGELVDPSPRQSSFGLVDPYTFATHEDYCALNLDDKPMEQMILQQFMRPGSGFNELVAICGMRSGKGTVGSVAVWYFIYRLMELSNPQKYYGVTLGQTISTVNMALSEPQAKVNVFKHIKDRIMHGGRWFQELKAHCDNRIPNWNLDLELRLPKSLAMRCGHSRAKSLVGGTNIAVVFDELCKYKTSEGADNAESVYTQMKATTATFGEEALVMSISSPEWEGDYGMTLLRQAVERGDSPIEERCEECRIVAEKPGYQPTPTKSHPRMFGLQMATWEANTSLTYERLFDAQGGAKNPKAFWRDFGAKPLTALEGYYADPERWDRQPDPTLRYPYDSRGALADWFKPCCPSRRFVHVDLAVSRDAAGVAMAHRPVPGCRFFDRITTDEGLVDNADSKKAVVDVCVQIKPDIKPSGQVVSEIDFEGIRDMIYEWQDAGFKVKDGRVTYDGFQSVDSRQMLRKKGFRSAEFSCDRNLKAHDTLQELVNTDQLAFPAHPVLIREGKQLQLKNGRKVDHPPNGSKDVIDAVAGSVYHAVTVGGHRSFIGGRPEAEQA